MKQELKAITFFLFLSSIFIVSHEMTHASVYEDFNCFNVEVNIPDLDDQRYLASTEATCINSSYPEVKVAQQNVEASGYQLFPAYLLLTLLTTLYMYNEELL